MAEKEVFFHVGLGKTASTFLQKKIFPNLRGVHYVPARRYGKSKKIIRESAARKILISREFDRQFEEEARRFAKDFPEARLIIVFRRHDEWIASQYKRHVKNGFFMPFEAFLDIDRDQGHWKKQELDYQGKLNVIYECFVHRPLILIYDDLIGRPQEFIGKITSYLGIDPPEKICHERVHASFSDKQLLVLRAFCKKYIGTVPINYRNKTKHWLLYRPVWAFYHLILYAAKFIPPSRAPEGPLIDDARLRTVKQEYLKDWKTVVEKSATYQQD